MRSVLNAPARLICSLLFLLPSRAQTSAPGFQLIFHNRYVEVFDLELQPDRQAPIHDNIYDLVWIALDDEVLQVEQREGGTKELQLFAGEAHFFPSDQVKSLVNAMRGPLHSVFVEVRPRGLTWHGCGCSGEVERAVCGCTSAPHLPQSWALAMGNLTLAETKLEPGESLEEAHDRDDTLLIAVRPVRLQHQVNLGNPEDWVASEPSNINLAAGGAAWLPRGKHHVKNLSERPAHFITIEF